MNYIGNEPAPAGVILVGDTNPVGAIAFFHAPPDGSWVRLNGQVLIKASYPDLWTYAQSFLTADQVANPGLYKDVASGTFAVPKLDGLFIRAAGQVDANRAAAALGVLQGDQFQSHIHPQHTATNLFIGGGTGDGGSPVRITGGDVGDPKTGAGGAVRAGMETRGINVALVPCVKALRTVLMPSAAMPAKDFELLDVRDAAASAQLDFALTGSFDSYELRLLSLVPATDDTSLHVRYSNDGGATFYSGASNYEESYNFVQNGVNIAGSRQNTQLQIGTQCTSNVNAGGWSGTVALLRLAQANGGRQANSFVGCYRAGTSQMLWTSSGRGIINNLPVNAVRIYPGGGALATGRVKLYGVR